MAASIKSIKIGVIAEEDNDVEVISELIAKCIKRNAFSVSRFVGHGCGKLRNKCSVWATTLRDRGCAVIIVVHDLDRNSLTSLRRFLESAVATAKPENSIVLIPIEELEAWLLCDPAAIRDVFHMRRLPKTPNHPESVKDPKEYLEELVNKNSRTHYLNTVHNERIAAKMHLSCLSRCPSCSDLPQFLRPIFNRRYHVTES